MAQARDYANTAESKGTETNWDSINFTSSAIPSAQRGGPKLQRFSTKQTTTATVIYPRFCPASKRETQGRKRTENERGSSNHTSTEGLERPRRVHQAAAGCGRLRGTKDATSKLVVLGIWCRLRHLLMHPSLAWAEADGGQIH